MSEQIYQSQRMVLIDLFDRGEKITSQDAERKYGIARLAGRISELIHKHGYPIGKEWIDAPTRYGDKTTRVKRYFKGKEEVVNGTTN